jgi:hypothetical protein
VCAYIEKKNQFSTQVKQSFCVCAKKIVRQDRYNSVREKKLKKEKPKGEEKKEEIRQTQTWRPKA